MTILLCPLLLSASTMAQVKRGAPNIVLITIDTLRADRLGCYGSKSVATPAMDSLARDGVVFERAFSQVPLTFPSHAAILTGTYPAHNGVQDFTSPPLSPEFRTLAESLRANGYATGAVVSSFVLDRSWGMARGFDFYDDAFPGTSFFEKGPALVERRAKESVDHAMAWLRRTRRRPFFLWLHLYDPHSPYVPPEPYRSRFPATLEGAYDGEIAATDAQVGRLIDFLTSSRRLANTVIVVVGDHGESLGEHGEQQHGFFVYDASVRIPLIVAGPRVPTRAVPDQVRIVDVMPTILELAGVGAPSAVQGVSRPENVRMMNLLDIHVEVLTPAQMKEFDRIAMVDVQHVRVDAYVRVTSRELGGHEPVRRGAQPEPLGQKQELLAIGPGVRGDAAQRPLLEQVVVVAQGRDVRQVDAGHRQRATTVQRVERDRHEVTHRGEQDSGVQLLRRGIGRPTD
jgi:hypothetical protein